MMETALGEKGSEPYSTHLNRIETSGSVLLSKEAFEKLYLNPKVPSHGQGRMKFGNPTPVSLIGFLICATSSSIIMMGWGGAGGGGGAILSAYIFFGGILQILGAIGEFIIGNTFSCAVFFTYGAFWLVEGTSLIPSFGVGVNYSSTGNNMEGITTSGYHACIGIYYIALAVLSFLFLVCSIRTNVCLLSAIVLIVVTFTLSACSNFQIAFGNDHLGDRLQVVAGAVKFILCMPVWYILIAQMLESVDHPWSIPVGDLSTVVLGKSQRISHSDVI
ncbi:GPR1/FUN34/yaaH family-domain-containing protein [Penicillium sp. CMV-2018d]|nr:GPR1/FUN34/yaaH family-domain-containing protein [Penicillium sp. CMV-2018d]